MDSGQAPSRQGFELVEGPGRVLGGTPAWPWGLSLTLCSEATPGVPSGASELPVWLEEARRKTWPCRGGSGGGGGSQKGGVA